MPDSLQSPIDIAAPLTRDDLPPLDFRYPAAIAVTAELGVQRRPPRRAAPRHRPGRRHAAGGRRRAAPRWRRLRTDVAALAHARRARHRRPAPADGAAPRPRRPRRRHPRRRRALRATAPPTPPSPPSSTSLAALRDATAVAVPALDLAGLLPPPGRRASYRYEGSLTTADDDGVFRDGVQWVVMREPVAAAPAQIDAHRALIDAPLDRPNPTGNARDLQPRAGREILSDG